jgi:hypothetical protein
VRRSHEAIPVSYRPPQPFALSLRCVRVRGNRDGRCAKSSSFHRAELNKVQVRFDISRLLLTGPVEAGRVREFNNEKE